MEKTCEFSRDIVHFLLIVEHFSVTFFSLPTKIERVIIICRDFLITISNAGYLDN